LGPLRLPRFWAWGLLAAVWCGDVHAEGGSTQAESWEVHAPAAAGQQALTVRVKRGGRVEAAVCAKGPCVVGARAGAGAAPTAVELGVEVRALGDPPPRLEVLELGRGRRVVHVRWGEEPSEHLVLAAPLRGRDPIVVHRGPSDRFEGLEGERVAAHVEVTGGTQPQLVVGELRENLSLCGRPALLAPQILDPATLTLKPARLQRLSARERKAAAHVVARVVEAPAAGAMQLQAVGASSAVGRPAHVSDGDPETTWAEGGGGAGRGEFVLLRAPQDVPIASFEFVFRPPSGGAPHAAVPRSFWLSADGQLLRVDVPEEASTTPGVRLRVELPEPWRTSCVAWVAEEAYGSGAELDVTLAELVALPEGGDASTEQLIEWILADGDQARTAVPLLAARAGAAGPAVTGALTAASERARQRLLDVADRLECRESAPVYAGALSLGGRELADRAHRGLGRCGDDAPDALLGALEGALPNAEARLALALAPLAPALAVERLTPRLATPSAARRFGLRQALAEAVAAPSAEGSVRRLLQDPALADAARLDLLRSIQTRLVHFRPESAQAFERLAQERSFRSRYLLLGPAVALADTEPAARAFLATALTSDEHAAVRAGAATRLGEAFAETRDLRERARLVRTFEPQLRRLLRDDNVRVREAAARALAGAGSAASAGDLVRLLESERWPLVRRSAVFALGEVGTGDDVEGALLRSLGRDESSGVRAASARALGRRGGAGAVSALTSAFRDKEEATEVRVEAARGLGALCAQSAAPALLEAALRLTDLHLDAAERSVSAAAVRALGELQPEGLARRLAPLLGDKVHPSVRELAREAVAPRPRGRQGCGSQRLSRVKS
jgi:HEAT repeat protein